MRPIVSRLSTAPARSALLDLSCATLVAAAALSLYISTLQPDFGGPEDTPKFQFLGYVLGSAHPPGYPLYVLLSHAFVQLPIRTIAYRANLFSAVMASVACAIAYAIARQIGGGRLASLATALAMASGQAFWRAAVFAEVYSLAASIAAATISLLIAWGRSGRLSRLFGAAAAFAMGLGNHLTIVGLAPACVIYALMKNWRVLTPRVLGALALIGSIGLAQYGLIIVRTRQGAPYMESRADSLPELWRVITAERFAGERFAFGPDVLLTVHLPAAVRAIAQDLGVLGAVLGASGMLGLIIQRSGSAVLLIGAVAGLLGMVVNLAGDVQGFITPMLPLLWPFAAVGAEYVRRTLLRLNASRRFASIVACAVAVALPAWNVISNYRRADQSHRHEESRFLRAFYSQLPDRAAVVAQDYQTGMAINYMTLTPERGPDRGIARLGFSGGEIRDALREGRRVFVFAAGATVLSAEGFRFKRMTVEGPPVEDWLAWLPRRALVVGATAHVPFQLDLRRIGHGAARPLGRLRQYEAFAIITGASDATWQNGDGPVGFRAFETPVTLNAGESGARIEREGHTIAHVSNGLALATVSEDTSVIRPLEFPAGRPMNVAYQEAVYEFAGETACIPLSESWRDVTPTLQSGSWVATLHERGSVVIEVAVANSVRHANASVLLGNGVATPITNRLLSGNVIIFSTEFTRTGDYRPVFRFTTDQIPFAAKARVAGGSVRAMSICSHEPLVPLFADDNNRTLLRPDFEAEPYFGAGWSNVERTSAGRQRRGRNGASLFLPLDRQYSYRLLLELDAPSRVSADIVINGTLAGTCDIVGVVRCELDVPPTLVREGLNTLTFATRAIGDKSLGWEFAIHRVELSR